MRLAWRDFTARVDALSDDEVGRLDPDLSAWPDALRTTPGRWWRHLLDGQDEPRLRFVRCVDHVVFDRPERRARLAWADTPWLAELTILRLHDAAVGDEGPRALARSRFSRSLRELALSTAMTADGVAELTAAPLDGLKILSLNRNRIGARGVANLRALRSLEALHLGRNRIDDEGLDALGHWPSLTRVDLDHNAFSHAGIERLCASGRLAGLRELNLSNNPLDVRACRALASCKDLAALQVLFLHNCNLDDDGLDVLLSSQHLRGLGNLALSENRLGERAFASLASSPLLEGLHELDVCHNALSADDAEQRLRHSPHLARVRRLCT